MAALQSTPMANTSSLSGKHPQKLTQRQQQALARREQIIHVSKKLFAKQGFVATSTKQIAQEVGVAEGLIFHYFPDKTSILTAVREQSSFASRVFSLLHESRGRSLRDVMTEVSLKWVKIVRQESEIIGILLAESQTDELLNKEINKVFGEVAGRFAEYFADRIKAGEMRSDVSPAESALMFVSPLLVFLMMNRHLSDEAWNKKASSYAKTCLEIWLSGVEAKSSKKKK